MQGIKHRHLLRSSERRDLLKRISETLKVDVEGIFGGKVNIEVAELHDGKSLVIINNRPLLVKSDGDLFPTLLFEELIRRLPKVFVDMGAVPHICSGADVMAPGIIKIDGEFKEGDLVAILDERHGKAICIAKALVSSETIKGLKKGKVLRNIHYVGDSIWKIIKEI